MNWTRIVMHHSLTIDGPKLSWNAIRDHHLHVRHWRDIGYNFGVELVDGHFNALIGMPLNKRGIHAPGANDDGIGVCIVGNFDEAPPGAPILRFTARYVVAPMIHILSMDFPTCLVGHKDVTPGRTCPGKFFDMDALVAYVSEALV